MEIRTFVFGLVSGAGAFAVLDWVLTAEEAADTIAPSSLQRSAQPDVMAETPASISTRTAAPARNPRHQQDAETQPGSAVEVARHTSISPRVKDNSVEIPLQDGPERDETSPTEEGEPGREPHRFDNRGELHAEAKDDGWAYYTEQAIQQFLASHPAAQSFDVSHIECRTTLCQIEVTGYDESTGPVWHQVTYDLRQQPWSEFTQSGSSFGYVDGRFVIVHKLRR